jgi:hypothetical protein
MYRHKKKGKMVFCKFLLFGVFLLPWNHWLHDSKDDSAQEVSIVTA